MLQGKCKIRVVQQYVANHRYTAMLQSGVNLAAVEKWT